MELHNRAGHAVLFCYGHFLDSLLAKLYHVKESFSPIGKLSCSIGLQYLQKERTSAYNLIEVDKTINKMLIVFCAICEEVGLLIKEFEEDFVKCLLQYEEEAIEEMTNEEIYVSISQFLPKLLDLLIFVRRCRQVLLHFLSQLSAAFTYSWSKESNNILHFKFQEIFQYFGDLLLLFVSIDLSVNFNGNKKIAKHLHSFWQHIKISPPASDVKTLKKVLLEIQEELFSQSIFQSTLHVLFEEKIFLKNWNNFPTHFSKHMKRKLVEVEKAKESDIGALTSWARLAVSHVFISKSFGITDKKVHRTAIELSKKLIVVPLYGGLVWKPGAFFSEFLDAKSLEMNNKINGSINTFHKKRMEFIENNLTNEVKNYSFSVYKWALIMEDVVSPDASFSKPRGGLAQLLMEGLHMSEEIKFYINNVIHFHGNDGQPITKLSILNLCKLIELLVGVHSVFRRHHIEIGKGLNHTIQKRVMLLLSTVLEIKKSVFKSGFQEKYVDSYSALILSEKILYTSCSPEKLLIIRLALTLINHHPLLTMESNDAILALLRELNELCLIQEKLEKTRGVNFFFLEENVLPIYFKHLTGTHSVATRLQYLLDISSSQNPAYDSQRKSLIKNKVIKELAEDIEVHLRLRAHAHLKDNTQLERAKNSYPSILCKTPFRVYNYFITIKELIESYINETFYDLTTVALHDWQSYCEMRSLAGHQLGLETVEDQLPTQTISQGIDVLEIMRNIQIFVGKYLYNLNTQCFVEHSSNNKHLNTIRIHQIANSIRTHGTGIINTTVNFIYQFLRKKLLLCSQFLYDEHINSRLTKDHKYFSQQKLLKQALYPFERAEKFNKGISRLKTSSEGLSYLDQYRNLISQLGNALGYVRLVRSGGRHHSMDTVAYWPPAALLPPPAPLSISSTAQLSFQNTFFNVLHHLNIEIDALKLLVDVFLPVFDSPENEHLRLFVMIIPPLTINFVNYIVTSKEKLSKRNSSSGLFTDDGFAMGVAYLLSVFNLNEDFESLHWFESVREKYEAEERQLRHAKSSLEKDDGSDNTVNLSIKRLLMYKQEFELLHYNLNSAKVFFSERSSRNEF